MKRSQSVPHDMRASAVAMEHRAPMPRHTLPTLPPSEADSSPSSSSSVVVDHSEDEIQQHPWLTLMHSLKVPKRPQKCVHDNRNPLDEAVSTWASEERKIPISVVVAELFVTGVVLSFGIISFWYGTWTILDLAMELVYGSLPADKWKGLLTVLAIGLAALVLAVVMSRTRVADYIYRQTRPTSWRELILRTLADRLCQYLQSWGGICIWKAVWDIWFFFILPDSPWLGAMTAHLVGFVLLILTFSFRSAVTPPMIFVEDTIMREQLGSRWNLLTKLLIRLAHRRSLSPLERQWESEKNLLVDQG